MRTWHEVELRLKRDTVKALPSWPDTVAELSRTPRQAVNVLRAAEESGRPIIQPRCGVGGHSQMIALLGELSAADPGMLSVTIDSHTRLMRFDRAARVLAKRPSDLNGYPLVAHGWQRGRELVKSVDVPLEIRHGSPDACDLFAMALASCITSFEGGGIGYNLPYSKNVPLRASLEAWRQVDAVCGMLAEDGVFMERELFGTLTAVLIPPSVSISVTMLEAVAAAAVGVKYLSIAYPQAGEIHQDIAALRSIRELARRYLPADVTVYPVLHEFMGVFPRHPMAADSLIFYGGLTARMGGATKVISKTNQEAYGIPSAEANAGGIRMAALGTNPLLDWVHVDEDRVAEEMHWVQREVAELIEPVLAASDLAESICRAFAQGRLDIPFSASTNARSDVLPARDDSGAIRYQRTGRLPFSAEVKKRNSALLDRAPADDLIGAITSDVNYFLNTDKVWTPTEEVPS